MGNINAATVTLGGLGTTYSSGGFYQYKVPNGWSGSITCTDPNYNTSTPASYSFTASSHNYSRNFVMSNTTSCTTPTTVVQVEKFIQLISECRFKNVISSRSVIHFNQIWLNQKCNE